MNNTKLVIKETALNLFSKNGFHAVSIRDICKEVGIKESTIYYHFENKQDIFNELLSDFYEITKTKKEKFSSELSTISWVEEQPFILVGLGFLNNYFLNEIVLKFLRMLSLEQQGNEKAAELYHQVLFDDPLQHCSAVFKTLIQIGCFAEGDIDCMAMEYYAPIFLIFNKYFACGEITDIKHKEANEILTVQLRKFYVRYCTNTTRKVK